jgi:hypothetical protein
MKDRDEGRFRKDRYTVEEGRQGRWGVADCGWTLISNPSMSQTNYEGTDCNRISHIYAFPYILIEIKFRNFSLLTTVEHLLFQF